MKTLTKEIEQDTNPKILAQKMVDVSFWCNGDFTKIILEWESPF